MAWQEELRRLDQERVAGRLSEEDYQRQRAELAAQVPAERGGEQATQHDPFPPAFRWDGTPEEPPTETTDAVHPDEDGDPESTQRVPAQPPPGPSYDDPERTQVVQAAPPPDYGPPSLSGGGFPAGSDQWEQQEAAPLWASSPVSPFDQPSSERGRQGFDTFTSPPSSKTPRVVGIAAVVVVLLVGGALGGYWLWGPPGSSATDPPPVAQQQPPAPAPPAPPPAPDLPDPAKIGGEGEPRVLSTLEQLRATEALPPQAYPVLAEADATSSKLLVSSYPDGLRATVLIIQLASAEGAAAARDGLAGLQASEGLQELPETQDPGLRTFFPLDNPETGLPARGLYHSGDLLVWMEVTGQEPHSKARRYAYVVEQQLSTLSADR